MVEIITTRYDIHNTKIIKDIIIHQVKELANRASPEYSFNRIKIIIGVKRLEEDDYC